LKLETSPLGLAMPVFNEARWLDAVLERVLARPEVAQVVAVDDGSTDGSWEKVQAWARKDPRVTALRHDHNRGKGAAIRTALAQLTTPLILIQDADLEYDPADYPKLLALILSGEADVVYGSRFLGAKGSSSSSTEDGRATLLRSPECGMEWGSAGASPYQDRGGGVAPPPPSAQAAIVRADSITRTRTSGWHWHRWGNRLLTWAANWLTGLRLTDEATCYKLFKRDVLARIELTEDGFGFCPEVTAKVAKLVRSGEVRLVEVPIRYHGRTRAEGKKIRLRDGLAALRCLWRHSG
jgi:glycosyltransferase involved in cell wall biosynthesis